MTTIRGMRHLKNVTQDNLARAIRKVIVETQANRAPFASFVMSLKGEACANMKFEWFEHTNMPARVAVDGAIADVAETHIQLHAGQAAYLQLNTLLMNFRTDEVYRIVGVDTATDIVTVTRNFNAGGAVAIADDDVLGIVSEAAEEGVDFGDAVTNESDPLYNYLQEFETPVDMSWLKLATQELTEADWPFQVRQKVAEHKEKKERAYLFGVRGLVSAGPVASHRVHYTGGLYQFIKADGTNYVDLSDGLLTKPVLDAWLAGPYSYGNQNRKILMTSPLGWLTVSNLAEGYQTIQRSEKTLGMTIQKVELNGHLYTLVENQQLVALDAEDMIFCIDMDHVQERYLAGGGMNFRTNWFKSVQGNASKSKKDVLYGIEGLEYSVAKAHGVLRNFKLQGE